MLTPVESVGDTFAASYRGDVFGWSAWESSAVDTPARSQSSSELGMGRVNNATGTINNSISYLTPNLAAGTYTLTAVTYQLTAAGIYSATVDGSAIGTFDGYGANTVNVVKTITGIAMTAGVHTLMFTMATKNASSSAYRYSIMSLTWTRTGA